MQRDGPTQTVVAGRAQTAARADRGRVVRRHAVTRLRRADDICAIVQSVDGEAWSWEDSGGWAVLRLYL